MRVLMGIIKNRHGVYLARKKVPPGFEEAVARVISRDRGRVSWLQRSLRTKDAREANIKAKPILAEFDQIIIRAKEHLGPHSHRSELTDDEIRRLADYLFASILEQDDDLRATGGSEEVFQNVAEQLRNAGVQATTGFTVGRKPGFGLSDRDFFKLTVSLRDFALPAAQAALAKGDIGYLEDEIVELLEEAGIDLPRSSPSFSKLGISVLRKHVAALKALIERQQGEPVETPKNDLGLQKRAASESNAETLRVALEGWKATGTRSAGSIREFEYAVERFVQLHGDLSIAAISRRYVREYREALQKIPMRRSGSLLRATLPELIEWSNEHPEAKRISASTVNKLLGGVQAVVLWGRTNGMVADDIVWADPFSNMRLKEEPPDREPWDPEELQLLFGSDIYVRRVVPRAGGDGAAFWLPLLGLFTGARLGELAPLLTSDIKIDAATKISFIEITDDDERGKRLKTRSSRRTVPVHPELIRLGFLQYAANQRSSGGADAPLFPRLFKGHESGHAQQWSKWFGRYIRSIGVRRAVFHSFRHSFKDALRAAGESEDINDALTGHSRPGVGSSYGSKDIVRRFGLMRLADAVAKVAYPGLDLSHLKPWV